MEFCSREELDADPVTGMEGGGTYGLPAGCWSDDTSMALAALVSLADGRLDYEEIMLLSLNRLDEGFGDFGVVHGFIMEEFAALSQREDPHVCGGVVDGGEQRVAW